jgi:hypothetical protein
MKINRLHTIIGLLLILIPFTGFTRGFKYGFSVVAGGVILFFAMKSIHQEVMKKQHRYKRHDSYAESKPREGSFGRPKNEVLNVENDENNNPPPNHIANE